LQIKHFAYALGKGDEHFPDLVGAGDLCATAALVISSHRL
jgi:hypothetical protein